MITRDIPSNVVAAGVPCRVIREIQKEEKSDYFKILEEKYGDNNQKIDIYRIFV